MKLSLPHFADSSLAFASKSMVTFLVILLFTLNICTLDQTAKVTLKIKPAPTP